MYYSNQEKFNKQGIKKQSVIFSIIKSLLIISFIVFFIIFFIRSFLFYPVKINHSSMQPIIQKNDTVFVLYKSLFTPKKNDIVLIKNKHNQVPFLCRIVAIEGEQISIKNSIVFVNNKPVKYIKKSPKTQYISQELSARDNLLKKDIRPNTFFCLNDNRSDLNDSRMWQNFSYIDIIGKIIFKNIIGFSINNSSR